MFDGRGVVMEFRLLGPVEVWTAAGPVDVGPSRQRAVLAALLVDAGRPVTVETVIDRVWGDTPPDRVRHTLYVYVARLRKALGSSRLLNRSGGYVLAVDPGQVDLHVFRSQVARARAASCPEAERATLLRRALDLWRGTPLADVPGEWAAQVREGWRQQHLEAAVSWAQAALSAGAPGALVGPLVELSTEHPLAEPLVAALMRALHASGRRAEALDCFARIRKRLADELGVDPGAELQALHQAILRSDAAPASVSAPAPAPSPAQLPLDVHGFTGRAEALAQLDRTLQGSAEQPTAVVISAIAGTAGVGKTALAVHWAHRITDRFPDGQLYVNLRGFDPSGSVVAPAEALRGFLDALEVPSHRVPSTIEAQATLYRSLLTGRRMLVVLDNARDAEQVRPLLPGSATCLVLVTSRNQLTSLVAAEGAQPLPLDLLTRDEARQLLVRRLGEARLAAEPAAVDEVIDACAGLPLALTIVAARAVTNPKRPLGSLARELHEARNRLDVLDAGDPTADVRSVFSWSYRMLSPGPARLFRLLSVHPGPDIGVEAAASLAGLTTDAVRPVLTALVAAHLLTEHVTGRYANHDLLRVYSAELAERTDSEEDRRDALRRALDHYLRTAHAAALLVDPQREPILSDQPVPGVTPDPLADRAEALAWFAATHATLLAAIRSAAAAGFDTHTWQLAWTVTDHLQRQGHWNDQLAVHSAALDAAVRLHDWSAQSRAHRHLARAYTLLARYDDAQIHHRSALDLSRELGDHNGQAQTHMNLSALYTRQGLHRKALGHSQQALELFRAAGRVGGQARSLNMVGWNLVNLGDFEEAVTSCQQALVLLSEIDDRYGEAVTWDTLGYAYSHLGDHRQAIACYQRFYELFPDFDDHYDKAHALVRLGDSHLALGETGPARDVWRRALAIFEELDHPDADGVRGKLENLQREAAT